MIEPEWPRDCLWRPVLTSRDQRNQPYPTGWIYNKFLTIVYIRRRHTMILVLGPGRTNLRHSNSKG